MSFNTLQTNPDLFWHFIARENAQRRESLAQKFLPVLVHLGAGLETNLCLVGSDGKEERGPQSKTEIVVIKRPGEPSINAPLTSTFDLHDEHLETAYNGIFGEYEIPYYPDTIPNPPLSFQYGDHRKPYPDFLLSSHPLQSEPSSPALITFYEMRMHVLREMSDKGIVGRTIRDGMKKQLSSYRQAIVNRGVYAGERVFDEDAGLVYYDEADTSSPDEMPRARVFGIKIPYIRTVQRKLDLLTLQYLLTQKDNPDTIPDLAILSPTPTPFRILFLSELGVISQEQAEKLRKAYTYFLQLQHRCQAEYKNTRKMVKTPFSKTDFRLNATIIEDFVLPKEV